MSKQSQLFAHVFLTTVSVQRINACSIPKFSFGCPLSPEMPKSASPGNYIIICIFHSALLFNHQIFTTYALWAFLHAALQELSPNQKPHNTLLQKPVYCITLYFLFCTNVNLQNRLPLLGMVSHPWPHSPASILPKAESFHPVRPKREQPSLKPYLRFSTEVSVII